MLQHTRWTMLCIVGFCGLKKNLQQHRPHRPHRPPMPSTRSSVIYSVAFQFRGNISLRCAMQFLWGPTERCTCFVYMALREQGKSQKTNVVRFRRQMLTAKRIAKSKCKRINGAYDDRRCDEFMATHNNNKKTVQTQTERKRANMAMQMKIYHRSSLNAHVHNTTAVFGYIILCGLQLQQSDIRYSF